VSFVVCDTGSGLDVSGALLVSLGVVIAGAVGVEVGAAAGAVVCSTSGACSCVGTASVGVGACVGVGVDVGVDGADAETDAVAVAVEPICSSFGGSRASSRSLKLLDRDAADALPMLFVVSADEDLDKGVSDVFDPGGDSDFFIRRSKKTSYNARVFFFFR